MMENITTVLDFAWIKNIKEPFSSLRKYAKIKKGPRIAHYRFLARKK